MTLPLMLLAGCTLQLPSVSECQQSSECLAAFGWGSRCGEEGFCETAQRHERCDLTEPADLFEDRQAHVDRVVLGSVYDRSAFPLEMQSIALAVRQVNDNNGLDGRLFGLVQCNSAEGFVDDGLSTDEASDAMATYLAQSVGVPAVVGPATSGRSQSAFPIFERSDVLMISPSATSPALTFLDGLAHTDDSPGLLWRTAPPDDLQGAVIARDVEQRKHERVAVIHQTGPYGEGLAEVFAAQFAGTAELFPYTQGSDRDAALAAVNEDVFVDVVLFISSDRSDITEFLLAAAALSLQREIFLTDGAFDTDILAAVRDVSGGLEVLGRVRGTRPAVPSGIVFDQFVASFAAAYDGQDAASSGFTSYAYDAAWLAIYGAAWANYNESTITGTHVARGLRRVSSGSEVVIRPSSWNAVRANFQEGNGVDVQGASGALDYDPATEETSAPIDIFVVDKAGEDFVVVSTETL
ncbi:MAG: ABC transporter substrate-binding protein [Myxococcales bacterium]|nr:ABC transporter substrate-binding protein [Myxococcales bacterium]